MTATDHEKIHQLEMLVMEQEKTIETYSDLLRDHQAQIDALQLRLELIEQKLSKHDEVSETAARHELPPHY
jgi:uncharacterized coiled-coil protein SlyX